MGPGPRPLGSGPGRPPTPRPPSPSPSSARRISRRMRRIRNCRIRQCYPSARLSRQVEDLSPNLTRKNPHTPFPHVWRPHFSHMSKNHVCFAPLERKKTKLPLSSLTAVSPSFLCLACLALRPHSHPPTHPPPLRPPPTPSVSPPPPPQAPRCTPPWPPATTLDCRAMAP